MRHTVVPPLCNPEHSSCGCAGLDSHKELSNHSSPSMHCVRKKKNPDPTGKGEGKLLHLPDIASIHYFVFLYGDKADCGV